MNVIFWVVCLLSACIFMIQNPQIFLSSLLDGTSKSAVLCFSLISTYAVWLGLMRVWQDSGLATAVSARLYPLTKRLLKTNDRETLDCLSMNLAVNMLGISGAATPYGIRGARLLDKTEHAEHSSAVFFILNATSLQVIPTSVIGVRTALQSTAPADIVLPTLITSAFSTILGLLLVCLLIPYKQRKRRVFRAFSSKKQRSNTKMAGAGI
jgi:spore maturation protein A